MPDKESYELTCLQDSGDNKWSEIACRKRRLETLSIVMLEERREWCHHACANNYKTYVEGTLPERRVQRPHDVAMRRSRRRHGNVPVTLKPIMVPCDIPATKVQRRGDVAC